MAGLGGLGALGASALGSSGLGGLGASALGSSGLGALGSALGIKPPPPPYVKGTFNWPLAKWMHTLLTGIFPFLPFIPYIGPAFFSLFSTWGSNGANLLLTNSMGWALAKGGFNYACRGAYMLIAMSYPGQWWLPYIKSILYYANPWYTFDMVQAQSDTFADEGYKMPFVKGMYLNENINQRQGVIAWNKSQRVRIRNGAEPDILYPKSFSTPLTKDDIGFNEPVTDLSGTVKLDISGNTIFAVDASDNRIICYGFMTNIKLGMMLIFIYPWLLEMSSLFPPIVQAMFDPYVSWGITIVGGITTLVTALTAGSIYAAPSALANLSTLMPKLSGGGKKQHGGIKFPKINDVIQNVLDKTEELPAEQEGGGSKDAETDESIMFLGSLTIVSLAGISLALIRSKNLSGTNI
jgi:hypothetical protein